MTPDSESLRAQFTRVCIAGLRAPWKTPAGFDFLSETVEIGGGAKGPRPLAGTRGVLALYSTDFIRASCSRSASWVNAMARRTV